MKTLPSPSAFAQHWDLDPGVVYLNHGSFGACPRRVLRAQDRIRALMERELVRFFVEMLEGELDAVRDVLGPFVGCDPASIAPVTNATTGVATVLANLDLREGDDLLATSIEYPACLNNLDRAAARAGARVVVARLPFPYTTEQQVVESILSSVTDRTKVALISHVTSATATILPVKRIVAELKSRGVETIVDGAHAPGFIDVDIDDIGAGWYTANCHKWLCAPKSAAFLHVREDTQEGFRPLILSNHADDSRADRSKFLVEFDYVGTSDQSPFLTIGDAIGHGISGFVDGWPDVMRRNRELALRARDLLCNRLGTQPCVPDDMLGAMATVLLPAHEPDLAARLASRPTRHHDALQDGLMERHAIEVPIWAHEEHRFVRVSAQLYNSPEQYEYLADALVTELAREREV